MWRQYYCIYIVWSGSCVLYCLLGVKYTCKYWQMSLCIFGWLTSKTCFYFISFIAFRVIYLISVELMAALHFNLCVCISTVTVTNNRNFFAGLVYFLWETSFKKHIPLLFIRWIRPQQSRVATLARVKSPFCDGWIMYSLKPHLYSSPNRLSGHEPAHTASELLQAGPPETFSESVFSGSYCKWKHLAPTINYPPDWCHTAETPS